MMERICCTCRWYEEPTTDGGFGQCHRYPPHVPCIEKMVLNDSPRVERLTLVEESGVAFTDHPLVIFDGWCGEWEPADRAAYENGE